MNLINADSFYLPIRSESVHLVCTSPPYYNAKEYSTWESYDAYISDMMVAVGEMYRVLVNGGRLAINIPQGYDRPGNGGYKTVDANFVYIINNHGFEIRGHIVWNKLGLSPQGKGTAWGSWLSPSNPSLRDVHEVIIVAHKGNAQMPKTGDITIDKATFLESTKSIWDIPPVQSSWHSAPFPTEIPRRLIELYTYTNAIVLDPFSGSGTTVKVANELGRVGIGVDLHMPYLHQSDIDKIKMEKWLRGGSFIVEKKPKGDLPLFSMEREP